MKTITERIKVLSRELGVEVVEQALRGLDLLDPTHELVARSRLDEIEPLTDKAAAMCSTIFEVRFPDQPVPPREWWTIARVRRLLAFVPKDRVHGSEKQD